MRLCQKRLLFYLFQTLLYTHIKSERLFYKFADYDKRFIFQIKVAERFMTWYCLCTGSFYILMYNLSWIKTSEVTFNCSLHSIDRYTLWLYKPQIDVSSWGLDSVLHSTALIVWHIDDPGHCCILINGRHYMTVAGNRSKLTNGDQVVFMPVTMGGWGIMDLENLVVVLKP